LYGLNGTRIIVMWHKTIEWIQSDMFFWCSFGIEFFPIIRTSKCQAVESLGITGIPESQTRQPMLIDRALTFSSIVINERRLSSLTLSDKAIFKTERLSVQVLLVESIKKSISIRKEVIFKSKFMWINSAKIQFIKS